MKQNNPTLRIAISALALGCSALAANAQTIVFTETFDPLPEPLTDFNMQLGGNPESKPVNTKIFALGQWGLTLNGSIVSVGGDNGNALQPQLDDKNNGRVGGIFIDPALFAATGAGTYTLSFDVIPSSTPGAGRVYIGAGSGYDLSGTTDAKLNLNLSTNGFGVKKADGTLAWPALTASGGATATHLITTATQWVLGDGTETGEFREAPGAPFDVETAATLEVNFEYDGISAVVVGFGGYNTDVKIDNVSISTASSGGEDTWAGYTIVDGYVNTEGFMGWLYVAEDPWILSVSLDKYLYLPESAVSDSGAWTYLPK
jgi:hypothetical protein